MRRLEQLLELLPQGDRLVDIGTDHAQLPIMVVSSGKYARAIAADLRAKPLERARANVESVGLRDRIELIQTSGLNGIDLRSSDVVTICGLGGYEISNILRENIDSIPLGCKFILQPNWTFDVLRDFLAEHGFCYEDEWVIEERNHVYIILSLKFTNVSKKVTGLTNFIGPVIYRRLDDHLSGKQLLSTEVFETTLKYLIKMRDIATKRSLGQGHMVPIATELTSLISSLK